MPDVLTAGFIIKLNGSDATPDLMSNLVRVEVDRSLYMPGQFTLEFVDRELEWVDSTKFNIGTEIEIFASANPTRDSTAAANVSLILGVITALEPVYAEEGARMVVRGYDKLHNLQRGNKTYTHLQVTDSDIIREVAGEAGLSVQVDSTSVVHPYVIRDDISEYDFLKLLANRNGLAMLMDGATLKVKPPDGFGFPEVTLNWLEDLLEFRPTLSASGQVNEVTIRGWDPVQKREVVGKTASTPFAPNKIGISKRGFEIAKTDLTAKKYGVADVVGTQDQAQSLALAAFGRMASNDLTGEGLCQGEPTVKPGATVKLGGLGTQFSGTYLVTRTRQIYAAGSSYLTEFWVGGMSSGTLASLVNPGRAHEPQRSKAFTGLIAGIVTNTNDPDALGRVKVKFPSLSSEHESFWARVVAPGAGMERGFSNFPEVNDEVVIGFANGDPNYPYMLGGVWNGKDKMPSGQGETITGGEVKIREWKTRIGHVLRFTDDSSGGKIELIDGKGQNFLVINTADQKVSIESAGDVSVKAGKDVIVNAAMNVNVKAGTNIDLKAVNVSVEASAKIALKAAMVEIAGSGMVKISGATVMIN